MKANRFVIQTTVMAAAIAAGATMVMAQADAPPVKSPPTTPPARERVVERDLKKQAAPKLRRVSEITGELATGTKVVGTDGEKLGSIDHLALDLNSGKCAFAVVSSGGAAGVGETWRAVPLKALKFSELNEPARLNLTETQFEAAPTIDKDSWNRLSDTGYTTTIHKHYQIEVERDGDRVVEKTETKTYTTGDKTTNLVRSDVVIGMDVTNAQNENLGEVNDIVVDLQNCKTVYTVVGFGGFLGMGEKLFAVPWQALNLDRTEKQFVLNIDKDRLKDAPGFDRDKWPDMGDIRWTQTVHTFYGTQPDQIYGYVGEGNVPTDRNVRNDKQSRGWEYNGEYNRMFKANAHDTVTGTITNVDRNAPMTNMSEGVILNLRTNDGQSMPVHIGPAWFVDHQPVRFNNNDQVTVSGCKATVNGKPCLLATEVKGSNYTLTLRHKDGSPMWDVYRETGATMRETGREMDREREVPPSTPPSNPNTPPRNPNTPPGNNP